MSGIVWVILILSVVLIMMLISSSMWSPLKWVGYGLFKVAMGGLILFVFNAIGGYYDFTLPINPITAAMSGILGLPGFVSLIIIKSFIMV